MCKKIDEQHRRNGVRVIGLHGIGGIGKTTICKAMCNEMSKEFHGKVCHIELKSSSEPVQLLREVLKRLTDIRPEMLDGLNTDEVHEPLNFSFAISCISYNITLKIFLKFWGKKKLFWYL